MIIYGSKAKELAKEFIPDKCLHCGTQNSIDLHVFQKYAHIFWIPFFPLSKTGVSQCDHCKQVLKLKEMPESLRTTYENLKARTKTPVWMFSGIALIALLITVGVISDKNRDEKNSKIILAPQAGDIFEIKTGARQYTLYKVEKVSGDSVFIRANNYETNKASGINELKQKGNDAYSEDIYGFSKTELIQMLEKGEIINIDRK